MKKASTQIQGNPPRPGNIVFGRARESGVDTPSYSRIFRCRKGGFDFMGQVKLESEPPALHLEVFNENYFEEFEVSRDEVTPVLERKILTQLLSDRVTPESFKDTLRSLLQGESADAEPVPEAEPMPEPELIGEGEIDLDEIFGQLNAEYFDGKITARVEWSKKVNGKNLTSFRFGSYDPEKKFIRIHPRLQQDFVPRSVLELTLYHEMCHQWAPMKRKKGMWRAHHPEFKKKEREYRFYDEAHAWEKENWKKLLGPARKKGKPTKTEAPEITTLAG